MSSAAGLRSLIVASCVGIVLFAHVAGSAAAGPEPPRDVYAEAVGPDQVALSWRPGVAPAPGEAGPEERYEVFRDGQLVAQTTDRRVTDSWLLEQHRYSYVVKAIDGLGRSAESAPVQIATPPFDAALELPPYLQQLSSTGVVVVWQTFAPATTSLFFGRADGAEEIVKRDAERRRDHVVAVSGLEPDTLYRYRWISDGRIGPPAELRTPPANPGRFTFGVIGDFGIPTASSRANLGRLDRDNIDFAITTGDNAQIFGTEGEYRNGVLGPLSNLIARRALWPSIGNHDLYGLQNYLRYFALPGTERYYDFTYGGVLFLSLDSNRIDRRQRAWLAQELAHSSARCKVAYFHHPLWSSGVGYRNGVRKRRRAKLAPLLERGGVDLVLNGHVQNYERSRPLRGGRRSRRGIVYVVTGGGGARLTRFVTRKRPRWSARRGLFHHRLRITAEDHRLKAKAIDTRGNTRDSFAVRCR